MSEVKNLQEYENIYSNLRNEIIVLENLLYKIRNEWIGPASSEYQKQLNNLIFELREIEQQIKKIIYM